MTQSLAIMITAVLAAGTGVGADRKTDPAKRKLAVTVDTFDATGVPHKTAKAAHDMVKTAMAKSEVFQLYEREGAAGHRVMGSVSRLEDRWFVNLRLIDLESQQAVAAAEGDCGNEKDLKDLARDLVAKLGDIVKDQKLAAGVKPRPKPSEEPDPAAKPGRLAVIVQRLTGDHVDGARTKALTKVLADRLSNSRRFEVIPEGSSKPRVAAIAGSIRKMKEEYIVDLRVVQLKDNKILAQEQASCGDDYDLAEAVWNAVKKLEEATAKTPEGRDREADTREDNEE